MPSASTSKDDADRVNFEGNVEVRERLVSDREMALFAKCLKHGNDNLTGGGKRREARILCLSLVHSVQTAVFSLVARAVRFRIPRLSHRTSRRFTTSHKPIKGCQSWSI